MRPGLLHCFGFSLFLAACLVAGPARAQQNRIPTRDVAILPDVSLSVRGDWQKHQEARDMIISLVTGHPIDLANSDWDVEVTTDAELLGLFGKALGRPEGNQRPAPLLAPGRNLLVLPVGKFSTVNGTNIRRQVGQMDHVPDMIRAEYPEARDIKDGSTCFWYAMARAASLLRASSPEGYYLFAVSDEEDDPDYLEKGPPGHSYTDYRNYLKNYAALYPAESIQKMIDAHFERNGRTIGRGAYKPRSDFPMTLIARFYQRKFPTNDGTKVCLTWYAMGVKPIPIVETVAAPHYTPIVPPTFRREIKLLGGLESIGVKTFSYPNPLIVWQIPFGEVDGLSGARFEIRTPDQKLVPTVPASATGSSISPRLNGPKTAQLKLNPGKYTVQVVQGPEDGQPGLKSKTATIEIVPRSNWVLPLLAAVSGLLAIGIFIKTWRSLKPSATTG